MGWVVGPQEEEGMGGKVFLWAGIRDLMQFLVERAPSCIPSSGVEPGRGHSWVYQVGWETQVTEIPFSVTLEAYN